MHKTLHLALFLAIATFFSGAALAQGDGSNQSIEVRTYTLADENAEKALDNYLESALIPALKRQGLGPIGAFDRVDDADAPQVLLLISGPSVESVTSAAAKLADDSEYQQAAEEYLSTPASGPLVKRIQSELLHAFDCWPEVTVSELKKNDADRLFELRIYESPTERLGDLKVEMFNAGEVPIFLDSGITPVFMGQVLIGDLMPNLTYMTVHASNDARNEGWKKFIAHPDWKTLSGNERYAGTVSKIHKSDWKPKSYSDL